MAGRSRQTDFFSIVPRRSALVFFLAVFFTFAPIGALFVTSVAEQRPWTWWLVMGAVSGALAVCWAASFSLSRWFIVGIVVFTVLLGFFSGSDLLGVRGQPSLETLAIILAIVLGYILFVVFISGQGRTTIRLQTEMTLAGQIHETLVPPIVVANEAVEVRAISRASTEMGGDLVEVIQAPDHTDLFLIDVSGHGVKAGVVMGMIKSALRMGMTDQAGLSGLAAKLNDVIEQTTSPELYATMAAMRFDHRARRLQYLLAGHHPIVLHRATPTASNGRIERLGAPGLPLGLMAGSSWTVHETALAAGDLLAVYTDGLNETADADDEELGHEAIEESIARLAAGPLDPIEAALFELTRQHGPQNDDCSLLLARIR